MKGSDVLGLFSVFLVAHHAAAFLRPPCLKDASYGRGTYPHQRPVFTLVASPLSATSTANDINSGSISHHKILILGGGTGGCGSAAHLINEGMQAADICIVEPASTHYYQPLWTLVGAGIFDLATSARSMSDIIPKGVAWARDAASKIDPEINTVQCASGRKLTYDYLIVATGLQCDWDKIPGLQDALHNSQTSHVCSNYHPEYAENTWRVLRGLSEGSALFTQPPSPVKCGGAPQKIMWLTDDYLRRNNRRNAVDINFFMPQKVYFGVPRYAEVLESESKARGVGFVFETLLVGVNGERREATFQRVKDGSEYTLPYAMLHVTPPMSAPDFLKTSPLADPKGFVEVDKYTTQHVRYPNVFALGDSSSLPTSKTMAAITGQAPVLVHNLLRVMRGKRATATYDGFTSCPIVLGYDKLLMTEFVYDCVPQETFTRIPLPFLDQGKPSFFFFLVKKYVFPFVYWNLFMKGRWYGSRLIFKPDYSEADRRADVEEGSKDVKGMADAQAGKRA